MTRFDGLGGIHLTAEHGVRAMLLKMQDAMLENLENGCLPAGPLP